MSAALAETLLTDGTAERRSALALHHLRVSAYRIAAECEQMLDSLDPDRVLWQEALQGRPFRVARR